MARDYYDVLGVNRDADAEEVKRAFRSLARELHPDVSGDPDAEARFRELSEAYAVLSDEQGRRLYDRLGWRGRGRGFAPRRGAARAYASDPRAFLQDIESILAASVGRRGRDAAPAVVAEVEVDPYEAHVGATRTVTAADLRPCEACGGEGRRKMVSHADSGRFLVFEDCPACDGLGDVEAQREVEVTVPPRARDGDRIPVGPNAAILIRVGRARDRIGVRLAAAAALLVALAFFLYLLAL